VKHQEGPELTVGVGGDGREVVGGAVVDAAVQGLGPELRELGGVGASKLMASTEMLMMSCLIGGGVRRWWC
jgi:hypothetical protein